MVWYILATKVVGRVPGLCYGTYSGPMLWDGFRVHVVGQRTLRAGTLEQWSTLDWDCVSEQFASGPFFHTQVSPYVCSACLDPAVDPETKYDPVTD